MSLEDGAMTNLSEFLLARIAEDDAMAQAAIRPDRPGSHWHWVMDATDTPVAPGHLQAAQDDGESVSLRTVEETESRSGVGPLPHFVVQLGEVHGSGGEHIARWHPARVLAECDAKRQIVALHETKTEQQWVHVVDGPDRQETEYSCAICGWFPPESACDTLRLLALPHADHPDYDPAWRT